MLVLLPYSSFLVAIQNSFYTCLSIHLVPAESTAAIWSHLLSNAILNGTEEVSENKGSVPKKI